jgi:hypothetical protein
MTTAPASRVHVQHLIVRWRSSLAASPTPVHIAAVCHFPHKHSPVRLQALISFGLAQTKPDRNFVASNNSSLPALSDVSYVLIRHQKVE